MEQNNGGNAYRRYGIMGFKRHLPGAVDVAVAGVPFFVILVR